MDAFRLPSLLSRPRTTGPNGNSAASSGCEFQLGLFGVFGCGNFGNDATLEACLGGLQMQVPVSRIVCVAANPGRVAATYRVAAVPIAIAPSLAGGGGRFLGAFRRVIGEIRNFIRAWRLLCRVDTFVIAGTGVLDDQHVRPTHLPLDVFRWSLTARLARTRLVFLAVGAGPIDNSWSRFLLTRAVGFADEVSYRDQRSLQFMGSLGRDVRCDRVVPDLAFATTAPENVRPAGVAALRRIAIGLVGQVNWHGRPADYQRYENRLVELIVRLTKQGWEVRLVNGDEVDVDTQRAIVGRPELKGLAVFPDQTHSFAEVVEVLSRCHAMVASRYHNIVGAVIVGIPVISLGYGPKNVALLEQLHVADWGHAIDDFDVNEVLDQIRSATLSDHALYRVQLNRYREVLRHEFEALAGE